MRGAGSCVAGGLWLVVGVPFRSDFSVLRDGPGSCGRSCLGLAGTSFVVLTASYRDACDAGRSSWRPFRGTGASAMTRALARRIGLRQADGSLRIARPRGLEKHSAHLWRQ